MHYSFYIFLVFVGCCSNVVFLELLISAFPSSGNIITLAQFVFISIKGFIQEAKFGTKKPTIPLKKYMSLVIMFFVVSVLNNYALNFNISMPLHMIFRSYTLREYVAIVLISAGICICTMASSNDYKKASTQEGIIEPKDEDVTSFIWWIIGITMLTLALVLSACMGIIQEKLYKTYGKHPDEALFYNHVLTLPIFVFLYKDIFTHIHLFNQSEPFDLILFSLPLVWVYLILNTLTQYVCISSVFVLTTECTSLTVTLVLTLRKFTSLIISIIYFKNPFTFWHWTGTTFVFVGTLMFTNLIKIIHDHLLAKAKKDKTN